MNQRTKLASALLAIMLAFSLTAWSQDSQPTKPEGKIGQESAQVPAVNSYKQSPERYFQLTFRVLDTSAEGRVTNSRSYSEMFTTGPKSEFTGSIRTGDRVAVATGAGSLQFQYIDIGTKIDANRAEVVDRMLRLHVTADISSMSTTAPGSPEKPVIRHTSWDSNVIVPIGKPTLILSADNSADRGKTELELTAVPIGQ